jgi:hypothetical protein
MPSLNLINETAAWRLEGLFGREEVFPGGDVPVRPPLASPLLGRLQLRRLRCLCQGHRDTSMTSFGFANAIVDTGCPISLMPKSVWRGAFGYEEGKHFEVCTLANLGERVRSQLLGASLTCRIVRLKVPVVLVGTSYAAANLLRIDHLVTQLSDTDEPGQMLLGLWGGVFEGRRLVVDRTAGGDDLTARFDW